MTVPHEVLGTLFLDGRNRAIGHNLAYFGTLKSVHAEARGLFLPALLAHASRIILFHNHPTGDPTPSREDLQFTHDMTKAGKILGIQVVDHIIVGDPPTYRSLQEDGFAMPEERSG